MDTVTEKDMAIKMALNGGIGIIHRYMSIEDQVTQIKQVKRFLQYAITQPYTLPATATYEELITHHDKYGVSSFCIVYSLTSNNIIGIITRRDIEYMRESSTSETTTPIINYITKHPITLTITSQHELAHSNIEKLIKSAKSLMLEHKIEKVPLVYASTSSQQLAGLITLKNIRHYENNKSKACVDSNGALCVGAAIGIVDDWQLRLDSLVAEGCDLICIDVANGFNTNVISTIATIRQQYPNLVLMAGNVCNWQGYKSMCDVDIDLIRVGVGNGSICTTRLETGIGKGQFTAVNECFDVCYTSDHPSHQPPKYRANIVCDGGSLGKTGNNVKALASGAIAIMLGRTLASTEESPGHIIFRNGKRFKYVRGMASTMANLSKQEKTGKTAMGGKLNTKFTAEGVDGEQELTGSVEDVIEQINGGLKSGLSYLGCENIQQLHEKRQNNEIKFNVVTSIGMSETGIRVKTY
jgi:IMP dehydrogenase